MPNLFFANKLQTRLEYLSYNVPNKNEFHVMLG